MMAAAAGPATTMVCFLMKPHLSLLLLVQLPAAAAVPSVVVVVVVVDAEAPHRRLVLHRWRWVSAEVSWAGRAVEEPVEASCSS